MRNSFVRKIENAQIQKKSTKKKMEKKTYRSKQALTSAEKKER